MPYHTHVHTYSTQHPRPGQGHQLEGTAAKNCGETSRRAGAHWCRNAGAASHSLTTFATAVCFTSSSEASHMACHPCRRPIWQCRHTAQSTCRTRPARRHFVQVCSQCKSVSPQTQALRGAEHSDTQQVEQLPDGFVEYSDNIMRPAESHHVCCITGHFNLFRL